MCSQSCEPQQIFNSIMTEALSYRNESNQRTDFYLIGTPVMKELKKVTR